MLFGLCNLAMCVKVRGLQVVVRRRRMVGRGLVMMLNCGVRGLGSHERFLLNMNKRYGCVPRIAGSVLSIPFVTLTLQNPAH